MVVEFGMITLVVVVTALFVAAAWASAAPGEGRRDATRSALGLVALLSVSAAAALSGVLANTSRRPPLFVVLMAFCTAVTVVVARSRFGARVARLPLWALVGAQGFRLPLELVLHRAARASVMPVEMSFEGLNFDIITGTTALVLALALYSSRVPRLIVLAWSTMGSILLAVIVGVALAASPFMKAFGPVHVNDWILYFPYVWLPTVLVQAALFGHIVVFRRLLAEPVARAATGHGGSR